MSREEDFSYKHLIVFSLPLIVSSFLEPLSSIVDTALVGHLNTSWLASLALASTLFNSFTWIFNFFVHIPTQNLALYKSQERMDKIADVLKVALLLAITVGVVFSFILYFGRSFLFDLVGATSATVGQLDNYFAIRVFGQAIVLAYLVCLSSLRGLSRVNESFYLVLFSTVLNIIISYLFLYRFDMGIAGAAWGTVLANAIGVIISLALILKESEIRKYFFNFSWPKDVAMNFGKNSFNLFLRTFTLTTCFFLATRVASGLGVISLATHQIALNFWLFSSYFIDGLAITANVKAAGFWGKNDIKSLKEVTTKLVKLSAITGLLFTLVYGLLGPYIWHFFTEDPKVFEMMHTIWGWVVFTQVFTSMAYLYDGVLFGTTDFKFLRTHIMIGAILIFLPLLYFGYRNQSLHGIWAGLSLLALYRGASAAWRVSSYGK